jgi:hypothetical protein
MIVVMGLVLFPINNNQQTIQPVIVESKRIWSTQDSKSYARDQLVVWTQRQWSCLAKLWGKESAWNPRAFNKTKVMGRNAGGIPQILGLNPKTKPTKQIDRGLQYIYHRYHTPCQAWKHFKVKGWH